jgi:thiamine transport system permease protein
MRVADRALPRARRLAPVASAALPAAFIGLFYLHPLAGVLIRSFDAGVLVETWRNPTTTGVLWFTTWQALASTGICLVLALPTAAVLARLRFRGRALAHALLVVPFVLPTVVVAAAFLSLMDRLGLSGRFHHTVWAILAAHVFFNYAVIARSVGAFWSQLDPAPEQAAAVLGANRLRVFGAVTLPRLAPAVVAVSAIVFLFNFTSFGVILILGGPRRATLDTEIWRFAVQRLEFDTAAALALLQLLCVLVLVVGGTVYQQRRHVAERLRADSARRAGTRGDRLLLGGTLGCAAVVVGLPLAMLVERSLRSGGAYTVDNFRRLGASDERLQALFVSPLSAVRHSLEFAATAAGIATIGGLLVALAVAEHSRRGGAALEGVFLMPLGTSAVILGFGMLLVLDRPPLDLRLSWWLVPIAHALIGMPFVIRSVTPALRAVSPRLREAAAVLGARPGRVRREVDLPLALRGLAVGAGFAFAVSLGEFGATSFVVRPERPTVPVAIFRLLGRPGETAFGQAMALSVILLAMTAAAVLLIDRLRPAGAADF